MPARFDKFLVRAASCVSSQPLAIPRNVGTGFEQPLQCHAISQSHAAGLGGDVVHGFRITAVDEIGPLRRAHFQFHSLIRTASGDLVDPNFPPGQQAPFVEDPTRTYDYGQSLTWNSLAVANMPFRCPVTETRIPAWKAACVATLSDKTIYSLDSRHARRRHLQEGQDFAGYVAGLGLDPTSAVDVVFATNLEIMQVGLEEGTDPPEHIKDFRRLDGSTLNLPDAIGLVARDDVLSEAEKRHLRQGDLLPGLSSR
jgi:hypothetical protein